MERLVDLATFEKTYTPHTRREKSSFQIWAQLAKNVFSSRETIFQMVRRDVFGSYKKSLLGVAWIGIAPIVGVISWIFMNYTGVLTPGDTSVPYPAYVLFSTSVWSLFAGFYSSSASTLRSGVGTITQIQYPHEILMVKQTIQHLINYSISLTLNCLILLSMGVGLSWKIIFFPFLVIPLFFLGAGIGLIVAILGSLIQEIQRGVDMLMGILIWVTPVIFTENQKNPVLAHVIKWNPLTYLIGAPRDLALMGTYSHLETYFMVFLGTTGFFLLSWRFFYLAEHRIVEKLS